MIIAYEKPLEEITAMLEDHSRVLNIGCAGCTAICLAGGPREVDRLSSELLHSCKITGKRLTMGNYTVERQCDQAFMAELDKRIEGYDAVLSMACGVGVQLVASRYPHLPVYPALNTVFAGIHVDVGWYEENCRMCGDCQLAYTGGICPVTRCAKSIFNGPCGGSCNGRCEVDDSIECAWCAIYERLKVQGRVDSILKIRQSVNWKTQKQGSLIQKGYEKLYS